MKTAVEKLNPTLAKIEVEVPFAEFKPYLDRTYKNLSVRSVFPASARVSCPSSSSSSAQVTTTLSKHL